MIPFGMNETITVKRRDASGSYVNGNWIDGAESTFTITCSIQPLNGSELQRLPENLRERRTEKIYTSTEIFNNDHLVIDGTDFQVYIVENWQRHPFLKHYKIIAIRKNYEGQTING